jgi:hypothetical protein
VKLRSALEARVGAVLGIRTELRIVVELHNVTVERGGKRLKEVSSVGYSYM